jgi:phosphoglycerate kinase
MGGHIKRTVSALPLRNKVVLLRADLDVPLVCGQADSEHIKKLLPTLQYLLKRQAKVIIVGHMGRPLGIEPEFSLAPVAKAIANALGKPVRFVDSSIGPKPTMAIKRAPNGSVIVLENLRFYKGEEANDLNFARELQKTTGAQYFVQDDKRAVRHSWASTDAIANLIPGFAGFAVMDTWDAPGVKSLLDA